MTIKPQLSLSTTQSPMDGEGSSQSAREKSDKELQISQWKKQLNGLIASSNEVARDHSPKTAFKGGLTLQTAKRVDKRSTALLLFSQLKRLAKSLNEIRSFRDDEDIKDAIEDIIEVYPSLKVEEVLVCFKHIRQGKFQLFGTLSSSTLMKCLSAYELQHTIPMREAKHKAQEPFSSQGIDWKRLSEDMSVDKPKKSLEELGGYVHLTEQDLKDIERAKKEGELRSERE